MELKKLNYGLVQIGNCEYPKDKLKWQWDNSNNLVMIKYDTEIIVDNVSWDLFTLNGDTFEDFDHLHQYVISLYGAPPNVVGGVYGSSVVQRYEGTGNMYIPLIDIICDAVKITSEADITIEWKKDDADTHGMQILPNTTSIIGGLNNAREIYVRGLGGPSGMYFNYEVIIF